MSVPPRNKPFLNLASQRESEPAARGRRRAAAVVSLVASIALLSGCGRREIVRPTPQMDVESQFWVRVLLLSNATECTVAATSALRVSGHDLSPALPAGEPMADPNTTK